MDTTSITQILKAAQPRRAVPPGLEPEALSRLLVPVLGTNGNEAADTPCEDLAMNNKVFMPIRTPFDAHPLALGMAAPVVRQIHEITSSVLYGDTRRRFHASRKPHSEAASHHTIWLMRQDANVDATTTSKQPHAAHSEQSRMRDLDSRSYTSLLLSNP